MQVVDVVQGYYFTWSVSDNISKRRRQAGLTHFDPLDLSSKVTHV